MDKMNKDQTDANKPSTDQTLRQVDQTLDQVDGAMRQVEGLASDVASEVQNLVWALVDDYLDEPGLRRLESLVLAHAEARATYIKCIQLHVDLIYYFAEQRRRDDPNAPATPFPLPAELQQLLQRSSEEKKGNDPIRCQARPKTSSLTIWWRKLNQRLDDWAFALNWNLRAMFERV